MPAGWPEGLRPPIWMELEVAGGMWMVETVDSLPYASVGMKCGVWCVDWADFRVLEHLIFLASHYPEGA